MRNTPSWLIYAILSAFFAALTAIFAKVGLKNMNADLATAIRTAIILFITWAIVLFKNAAKELPDLSRKHLVISRVIRSRYGLFMAFLLSGDTIGKGV